LVAGGAHMQVPVHKPFQIVRPNGNHSSMVVVPEGLELLQQHGQSIALISVVGPYHSGKSFLLNSLLGDPSVFTVGRKTSPETMGMWICRTELQAADGSEIWLMDSEGFFGPGVDQNYDAKVFTLASLMGAHVVYNTVKTIDQQAVNLLEVLVRQAQLFRSRSAAAGATPHEQVGMPEFLSTDTLPPFTWVVEDFVQEIPERFRQEGSTGTLSTYLSESSILDGPHGAHSSEAGSTAGFLEKLYRDVRVHPLFLPATSKEELQDLSKIHWGQLTKEFRSEIESLKQYLMSSTEARSFNGRVATGPVLAQALHFGLQALQQGKFNDLPSIWVSWAKQVAEMSLSDAESLFGMQLQKLDSGPEPTPLAEVNLRLEKARVRAADFYQQLIRDFEVKPNLAELRHRMESKLEQAVLLYHGRVKQWVGELVSRAKAQVSALLAVQALPTDPMELERLGGQVGSEQDRNLTEAIRTFAKAGPKTKHGPAVAMPIFTQDPVAQLRADVRALVGARANENEREIQQLLKVAEAAAAEAVQGELKANSDRLAGRARMQEVEKAAARRCMEAFEGQLSRYPWMHNAAHYRSTQALVRSEHLEARLQHFRAANDAKIRDHMRGGLERAIGAYRGNRTSIGMPAPEAEVEAGHMRLAKFTREGLAFHARGLEDTDAFADAIRRLDAVLGEGYQQAREKNVELWKVHSDDATRCAAAANMESERRCGSFCLFSLLPWAHKRTSRQHLANCFARSSSGSRMSPLLQSQVFEIWYSRDMGFAAQYVRYRFFTMLATVALICLGLWWRCAGAGRQQPAAAWGAAQPYQAGSQPYQAGFYGAGQGGCFDQQSQGGFGGIGSLGRRRRFGA